MARKSKAKHLKITLSKSLIGRKPAHRATAKALGLGRIGQTVEKDDTPAIRGMIKKIEYMLNVEGE